MASGGAFEHLKFTVPQRRGLFFGICLWVRLALAIGVVVAGRAYPRLTTLIVLLSSFMIVVANGVQQYRHPNVWWSRVTHMFLWGLVSVVSVLVLYQQLPIETLGVLIALDPLFGFFSALVLHKP